jgi:hypothetical protein
MASVIRVSLWLLAVMAVPAVCQAARSNPAGICGTAGQRCVNIVRSYHDAFGRDPQQGEIDHWMGQATSDSHAGLLAQHRNWLRQDRGAQEGAVRESYMTVFGYSPNSGSGEMRHWLPQAAQGVTYQDMVNAHMQYLRSDAGARESTIYRSYTVAFNRNATADEVRYWSAQVAQGGWTYDRLVQSHAEYAIAQGIFGKSSTTAPQAGMAVVEASTGRLVDHRGHYLLPPGASAGMVAAGAGNIVAAGAGNMVAAGAGNVTVSLPPNFAEHVGRLMAAAGSGNIVAAGAGNIVAAGAGNMVAAGGGNIRLMLRR